MPTKSLPLLIILVAVSCAGCRKVPYSDIFHAVVSHSTPQPAQVSAPSIPEPVAEGPLVPEIDRTAQVVVLGYDRFVDKVRRPDTEITPAEFESQMQALKDQGISVISLDDFQAGARARRASRNAARSSPSMTATTPPTPWRGRS